MICHIDIETVGLDFADLELRVGAKFAMNGQVFTVIDKASDDPKMMDKLREELEKVEVIQPKAVDYKPNSKIAQWKRERQPWRK